MDTPHDDTPTTDALSRRAALGIALRSGALLLTGSAAVALTACGSTGPRVTNGQLGAPIPGDPVYQRRSPHRSRSSWPAHATHRPPTVMTPTAAPTVAAPTPGVIARSHWAKGGPKPWLADKMQPIRRITIHHDGISTQPTGGWSNSVRRLESIRRGHLSNGWADIGYHYAVDPNGRVWACRPMSLQGAHVKNHNPGNLGIVVLGNYQTAQPTDAAKRSLAQFVTAQMHRYRVPPRRVVTHRELRPTACPGHHLQQFMNWTRSPGGTLASVRV